MTQHHEFEYMIRTFDDLDPVERERRQDAYSTARDQDFEALRTMQADPRLVALVRAKTKGSVQRTAPIPLTCSGRPIGDHVALKIIDGVIELVLLEVLGTTRGKAGNSPSLDRVVSLELGEAPVVFNCCSYGSRRTKISQVNLMRKALEALAASGTKRPAIPLHT